MLILMFDMCSFISCCLFVWLGSIHHGSQDLQRCVFLCFVLCVHLTKLYFRTPRSSSSSTCLWRCCVLFCVCVCVWNLNSRQLVEIPHDRSSPSVVHATRTPRERHRPVHCTAGVTGTPATTTIAAPTFRTGTTSVWHNQPYCTSLRATSLTSSRVSWQTSMIMLEPLAGYHNASLTYLYVHEGKLVVFSFSACVCVCACVCET